MQCKGIWGIFHHDQKVFEKDQNLHQVLIWDFLESHCSSMKMSEKQICPECAPSLHWNSVIPTSTEFFTIKELLFEKNLLWGHILELHFLNLWPKGVSEPILPLWGHERPLTRLSKDTLTFDLGPTVWAHKAGAFTAQRLYGERKYFIVK